MSLLQSKHRICGTLKTKEVSYADLTGTWEEKLSIFLMWGLSTLFRSILVAHSPAASHNPHSGQILYFSDGIVFCKVMPPPTTLYPGKGGGGFQLVCNNLSRLLTALGWGISVTCRRHFRTGGALQDWTKGTSVHFPVSSKGQVDPSRTSAKW